MSMFTPAGDGGRPSVRRSPDNRARPWVLVVAVLVTIALVGGAWLWSHRSAGTPVTTASKPSCSPASTTASQASATSAGTPSAPPPSTVTVNVYNSTQRQGLAARVAAEMKRRGFRIGAIANDPLKKPVTPAAQVRSGVAGKNAARTVAAQVGALSAYAPVVDKRRGLSVDLVLGNGFQALQPTAAAAVELEPEPKPTKLPATSC